MSLKGIVQGLHHVTATVNDAQEDYDFYTRTLGLRLVKETVNFDNEKVYHFYYANKTGAPSTVFTTFPYKGQGIRNGTIGTGQVTHTALSVPSASLDFWQERLRSAGVSFTERSLFGRPVLDFKDPAGLNLQITGAPEDRREPVWTTDDIAEAEAIRGIFYPILTVKDARETADFLRVFGYEEIEKEGVFTLFETGKGGPGNQLILRSAPEAERGRNGIGTVHHVAHRVDSVDQLHAIKAFMEEKYGSRVTDIKDRKYFQSIYFRIPGGVLFEVATSGPGFTVDESVENLGTALQLPGWQEPNRQRIDKFGEV